MKPPTFPNVAVVGMHFRERDGIPAKEWAQMIEPGTEIFYEREPANPFDPYAIKIMFNLMHMGFVERGQACYIAPWMDEGVEFICVVTDKELRKGGITPIVCFTPVEEEITDSEESYETCA